MIIACVPDLDVVDVSVDVLPGLRDGVKLAVGHVEAAALQVHVQRREWFKADQEVQHLEVVQKKSNELQEIVYRTYAETYSYF